MPGFDWPFAVFSCSCGIVVSRRMGVSAMQVLSISGPQLLDVHFHNTNLLAMKFEICEKHCQCHRGSSLPSANPIYHRFPGFNVDLEIAPNFETPG
jgi:hypothetical protein